MSNFISLAEIRSAQERLKAVAVRTPLVRLSRARLRMAGFAEHAGAAADIYLKDESAQPIRSFKLRGAFNKMAQLSPKDLSRGVITYSSGNHAQGVAYAARALGARATIVMPETTPIGKLEATRALGAEIVFVGAASSERKEKAEALAALHGYVIIPPYDDDAIIAGQATCGLEILEQLPAVDLVLSPVSGGGLLSGVSAALKLASAHGGVQVWGCEPELAADAKESFYSKELRTWPAAMTTRTHADGLRTQSLGERNFAHIQCFTDGIVAVTEAEMRLAMQIFLRATALVVEPSGAVTLAAALFHALELPASAKVVAIVSGGNLDATLQQELDAETATLGV